MSKLITSPTNMASKRAALASTPPAGQKFALPLAFSSKATNDKKPDKVDPQFTIGGADVGKFFSSQFASTKSSMEPSDCLNLFNMNTLGEPNPNQISRHDILSALQFDRQGDYLSVGDLGGRMIIFERVKDEKGEIDFEYLTEFQAHEKTFDTLNSCEVPEELTAIEWINTVKVPKPSLLTANSRCVKLWRIQNKRTRKYESAQRYLKKGKGLVIPKFKTTAENIDGKHIYTFTSQKEQRIHSVSLTPEGDSFLSSDENRVNLWNISSINRKTVYNLVDYERKSAG